MNGRVFARQNEAAERFASVAELDTIVDRIERVTDLGHPNMVAIEVRGVEVALGLGAALSFVQIQPLDGGDGPCWISVGVESDHGTTVFWQVGGEETEMDNRWLVPSELARTAVREFVRSGERLAVVEWLDLRSGALPLR